MFKRPSDIPYPSTWLTFEATDLEGKPTTYEIRDLVEADRDAAFELMTNFYVRDEPLAKVLEILGDPDSLEDMRASWAKSLAQKVAIGCFETKTQTLAGLNFLFIASRYDPKGFGKLKGARSHYNFKIYGQLLDEFDAANTFNSDFYLMEFGLGVHEDYRYRGIATQLLKARVPLMRALKVDNALTVFSAVGSQKAGEKAGYQIRLKYR